MTPEQLEKRKRIMQRSIRLGHCVCDPRKPCPCDLFKAKNVCECAGERLPKPVGEIRLTEYVRNAGCASKIGKAELRRVLAGLPEIDDPRVLVGRSAGDDAGIVRLEMAGDTVLTVDVFAPSVDDPYTFGQIAAANSVSDVYAMGGVPEAALSIIGFPIHTLPEDVMHEILRGGIDKMREAGVSVVGGHSINDEEIKCGFAVVGRVPRDGAVTNSGAAVGDALVLTKPIGGGVIAFARQCGMDVGRGVREMTEAMAALNRVAGENMRKYAAHAATDVTGFSLMGHLAEIVKNSGVAAEIDFDALPLFADAARMALADALPGAVERNIEAVDGKLLDLNGLAPAQRALLFCPETSGGLLVCLPKARADEFVLMLRDAGVARAAVIGGIVGQHEGGLIRVRSTNAATFAVPVVSAVDTAAGAETEAAERGSCSCDSCCCSSEPEGATRGSVEVAQPENVDEAFKNYMRAVNAPGALSVRQKKLIALALSVLAKCEPCVKINTDAAEKAGASAGEIAEAVALGISFGGAPVAMFYNSLKK